MLEKAERRRTPPRSASEAGSEGLSAEPELSQQVREEVQRHFENWIFQKVPALGGRTPLEAVADADGKEIVESCYWTGSGKPKKCPIREFSIPTSTLSAGCSN